MTKHGPQNLKSVCSISALLFLLGSVRAVQAQEGFPLDSFNPALGASDLAACRGLSLAKGRLSLALAGGWSWHLLDLSQEPNEGRLAEQSLSGGLGLELDLSRRLRLGFSAYGAPWQKGDRIDAWGNRQTLPAGWGESWLWAVLELAQSRLWQLGLEAGLRLPTANPEALAGEPSWGSRQGLLWEMELAPLRFLLNASLVERRRTFFYRLVRSSALQTAAGVQLAPRSWPAGAALEAWSELGLSGSVEQTAQVKLLGSGFVKLGNWRLLAGAGWGLQGEGTARLRVFIRLGTLLDFSHSLSE